jgi:hypothetical protein
LSKFRLAKEKTASRADRDSTETKSGDLLPAFMFEVIFS